MISAIKGYRGQVEAALHATTISSPTTYAWFGKHSWPLNQKVKQALTPSTARSYLLFTLQQRLYNDFYCAGFARPTEGNVAAIVAPGMNSLAETLAEANAGNGYWEAGWQAQRIEDGKVVVHKVGSIDIQLWVRPEDCLAPANAQIAPGVLLSLRFAKDLPSISPGFYMARGNRGLTGEDAQVLVRLYWNLSPEGAVRFMHDATTLLNAADLAFTLKVLNNSQHFTRCDAAVLYIRKSDYDAIAGTLATLYAAVEESLKQGTPAFTKRLAVGLGLAEDPPHGESFGEHRCHLLAEAIIRAHEQGKKSLDERFQVVEECFAEAGISLEKPFLGPGSEDVYSFRSLPAPVVGATFMAPAVGMVNSVDIVHADSGRDKSGLYDENAEVFLHAAEQIGRQIVREAIWHEGQCNWLGAGSLATDPYSSMRGLFNVTRYRALGPDLYDGTSGVALFLAELSLITRDMAMRQVALGAMRQALAHVDTLPPINRLGLYAGWIGIALAAIRVGTLLGEAELLCRARELLLRIQREKPQECEFDLIYGHAGAIIALVALGGILEDASLLDFAVQLGDELLDTAQRNDLRDAGCSWRSLNFPSQHNLTGLSHGTAGVAYALLELFQATGETKYSTTAEAAFNYERHWFNAEAGNWPDLRNDPFQRKRSKQKQHSFSFASYWCHGAAGIALSRLRAYQILNDERYKEEAITALQTTCNAVEATLYSGMDNFSLCHGLAGNAEILLEGGRVLGLEWVNADASALAVANFGINTYARGQRSWPCGIQGGTTPGLLLGLAGIGYFYLRLYEPSIPSMLLLQREHFVTPLL